MIELTPIENKVIVVCKRSNDAMEGLRQIYTVDFLCDANDRPNEFHATMFHMLFNIYLKINTDISLDKKELREIFFCAFNTDAGLTPIERSLNKLISCIRHNLVVNPDGTHRYHLDLSSENPRPV